MSESSVRKEVNSRTVFLTVWIEVVMAEILLEALVFPGQPALNEEDRSETFSTALAGVGPVGVPLIAVGVPIVGIVIQS